MSEAGSTEGETSRKRQGDAQSGRTTTPPASLSTGMRWCLGILAVALLAVGVYFTGWRESESLPTVALIVVAAVAGFLATAGKLPIRLLFKDGMGFDMSPEQVSQIEENTIQELLNALNDDLTEKIKEALSTQQERSAIHHIPPDSVASRAISLANEGLVFERVVLSELESTAQALGWRLEVQPDQNVDAILTKSAANDAPEIRLAVEIKNTLANSTASTRQLASIVAWMRLDGGLLFMREGIKVLHGTEKIWSFRNRTPQTISNALQFAENAVIGRAT